MGIKDSSGSLIDMVNYMDAIERAGSKAHFLTGREEALLATLDMGGYGCFTAPAPYCLSICPPSTGSGRKGTTNGPVPAEEDGARCPRHDAGHAVPGGLQAGP